MSLLKFSTEIYSTNNIKILILYHKCVFVICNFGWNSNCLTSREVRIAFFCRQREQMVGQVIFPLLGTTELREVIRTKRFKCNWILVIYTTSWELRQPIVPHTNSIETTFHLSLAPHSAPRQNHSIIESIKE